MRMEKSVCAIIVTYRIGKDLLRCFNSIKNQVGEVIIVDNGADSETVSVLNDLEKTHEKVKCFYNGDNLGLAAALNIGVRYALERGYDRILTLDHDSEATPQMVEKLFTTYSTLAKQGIKNVGIIAANPFDINVGKYIANENSVNGDCEVREVCHAITSGSLIDSRVFNCVGFFNESLFIYYVDDDFCFRCQNNKWRIYTCRSAVLLHQEGAKQVKKLLWRKYTYDNYDTYAIYYIMRNTIHMLRTYCRYHRYRYCYIPIRRVFVDGLKTILCDKNRIALLGFMIKGLFDGLRGKYGRLLNP
jgi:rhamnosyltransferase